MTGAALATKWFGVALLALFMLINFWDRASLGFAAVPIMHDLKLSPTQFGWLGSSFFILFAVSALAFGWLGNRCSLKWLIASMALVWAIAQAIMIGARTFQAAFASRVLLGAGEGSAFPTALHTAFCWFPADRHPLVTAWISVGGPLGIASGALLITWAIAAWGWHGAFALLCALSVAWAAAWIVLYPRAENVAPPLHDRASFGHRFETSLFGPTVTAFAVYWVFAVATYWFPAVMETANGFSAQTAAVVLSIAWAVQIPAFLLAAGAAGLLRNRGYSDKLALGTLASGGVAVSGAALVVAGLTTNGALASVSVVVCLASVASAVTTLPPMVGDASPQHSRSAAMGSFIGVASLAGLLAPVFFGAVVDLGGAGAAGYNTALTVSGVFVIVAAPAAYLSACRRRETLRPRNRF
jgi:MFS transporter, ACS family, D-galactonate transporter